MEASGDHESDLGFSERKANVEEDTQTEEDESKTRQKTSEAGTEHTTLRIHSLMSSPNFNNSIFSSRN